MFHDAKNNFTILTNVSDLQGIYYGNLKQDRNLT